MQQASITRFTFVSCALLALGAGVAQANAPDAATLTKIASLSVPFVPNAGQWDARAAFAARTFAGTVFVTTEGQIVYSLPGKPIATDADGKDGSSAPSPWGRATVSQVKRFGLR